MKTKILFVNDEMTIGGVSRILNTLLLNLDKEKYDIDLLILHPHGEMMKEIPPFVNVLPSTSFFEVIDLPLKDLIKKGKMLKLMKKLGFIFLMKTKLIRYFIYTERKKILKSEYDIEFSAKEGFCTVFTAYGSSKRKLNWVQADYKVHNYSKNYMPLMKEALSHIDLNIACSQQVADSFKEVFEISNVEVCHNLMDINRVKSLADEKSEEYFSKKDNLKLISVARFHPQKSIDRLIRAVSYAKKRSYELELVLIGGGPLEQELKKLTADLNCEDVIKFYGYSSNPYPAIKQADCFVLSSLYEGYPTIVLESFLSGTPVLACEVAGVKEQILSEEQGWIIENTQEELNKSILMLCEHIDLLKNYKERLSLYCGNNDEILQKMEDFFHGKN